MRQVRRFAVVAAALVAGSLFVVPRTLSAAAATISYVNAQNGLCCASDECRYRSAGPADPAPSALWPFDRHTSSYRPAPSIETLTMR